MAKNVPNTTRRSRARGRRPGPENTPSQDSPGARRRRSGGRNRVANRCGGTARSSPRISAMPNFVWYGRWTRLITSVRSVPFVTFASTLHPSRRTMSLWTTMIIRCCGGPLSSRQSRVRVVGAAELDLEGQDDARPVGVGLQGELRASVRRPTFGADREAPRRVVLDDEELRLGPAARDAADLGARFHVHRLQRLLPSRRTLEVADECVDDLRWTLHVNRLLEGHNSTWTPWPSCAARSTSAAAAASITPTPTDL